MKMKENYGNTLSTGNGFDDIEFYKYDDKISARELNRPIVKLYEDYEANKEVNKYLTELLFGTKSSCTIKCDGNLEVINNKLRIPFGIFYLEGKGIIYNRPNIERFERELASIFYYDITERFNDIKISYDETNKDYNVSLIYSNGNTVEEYKNDDITITDMYGIIEFIKTKIPVYNPNNVKNLSLEDYIDLSNLCLDTNTTYYLIYTGSGGNSTSRRFKLISESSYKLISESSYGPSLFKMNFTINDNIIEIKNLEKTINNFNPENLEIKNLFVGAKQWVVCDSTDELFTTT